MAGEANSEDTARTTAFCTTHWSVVLQASDPNAPEAHAALERLCKAYWYPLYACVRRHGYNPDDARDLTQEFFARLLEKNTLRHADQRRGRFRTFLQTALTNFLATEWAKGMSKKRGGGVMILSLDASEAEERYVAEPSDTVTPAKLFEQRWVTTVLELTVQSLKHEYATAGKAELFEALKNYIWGEGAASYAEIGAAHAMSEGAVKVAAHRLRERYRELLRAEVGKTVSTAEEAEDELRHLITIISS
jgi:DNA-directed RNA polymerase specialized sigma24 family protein